MTLTCPSTTTGWRTASGQSRWGGSLRAGKRAAAVMSLKPNGLDPCAYLRDVLERLPTQPDRRDLATSLAHCDPTALMGSRHPDIGRNQFSMDQTALYQCIQDAGYDLLMFEDHPQFFGNWRAHFKRGHDIYEIVCDNREGWMTLWRAIDEKSSERLHEVEVTRMDDAARLQTLDDWIVRR